MVEVVKRWTAQEMAVLAARGLGKVDALGPRGATLVTMDEIEAMAGLLAVFGLVPVAPGAVVSGHLLSQGPGE